MRLMLYHYGRTPPPLEAILVIFGRSFLNFFYLKGLGKIGKMTPPRRFSLPFLHILHVRCKFCVIRAVGRNPQILHV